MEPSKNTVDSVPDNAVTVDVTSTPEEEASVFEGTPTTMKGATDSSIISKTQEQTDADAGKTSLPIPAVDNDIAKHITNTQRNDLVVDSNNVEATKTEVDSTETDNVIPDPEPPVSTTKPRSNALEADEPTQNQASAKNISTPPSSETKGGADDLEEGEISEKDVRPVANGEVAGSPSVPPHLRQTPMAPRSYELQSSRYSTNTPGLPYTSPTPYVPQTPRSAKLSTSPHRNPQPRNRFPSYASQGPYRDGPSRDDTLPRLQAEVGHLRRQLEAERQQVQNMRKEVQAEMQKDIDAVLGPKMTSMLHKEVELEKKREILSVKELDLQRRIAQTEQLESFLTVGHKQLFHELDGHGTPFFPDAQVDMARRHGEADAMASLHQNQIALNAKAENLRIREDALTERENVWKSLVRSTVEAEVKAKLESDFDARAHRVSTEAFEEGFAQGKAKGSQEAAEADIEAAFNAGFAEALRQQKALVAFRKGDIPYNSPELAFMDPGHPNNPYHCGLPFERREAAAPQAQQAPPPRPTPRPSVTAHINGPTPMVNGSAARANSALPQINGPPPATGAPVHRSLPTTSPQPAPSAQTHEVHRFENGVITQANGVPVAPPTAPPTAASSAPEFKEIENLIDLDDPPKTEDNAAESRASD